MKETKLSSTEP